MKPARATSKDVARLAGVAQSTVSYVLNGKGAISEETRQRVRQAAAELNYLPNLAARSMRTRQSGRLAVVTGLQDYSAADVIEGSAQEAALAGYSLEVHSFDETAANQETRILELVQSAQVEGVLCFARLDPAVVAKIQAYVPIVLPDYFTAHMYSSGTLADASPISAFVTHLAAAGYTRFLHISGPPDSTSGIARERAYSTAISDLGLSSLGVIHGDWSAESGLAAVLGLPAEAAPLAIIAANDRVAIGAMRGAALRGWRVPDDVAVTGWDNYDISGFLNPPLTTVNVDRVAAGRWEMRRLIAALRGLPAPESPPQLNTIIWRESSIPHRLTTT